MGPAPSSTPIADRRAPTPIARMYSKRLIISDLRQAPRALTVESPSFRTYLADRPQKSRKPVNDRHESIHRFRAGSHS